MISLFAKILIPLVALTLGAGFFVLREMGDRNPFRPSHENSSESQTAANVDETASSTRQKDVDEKTSAEAKTATAPAETQTPAKTPANTEKPQDAKSSETPKLPEKISTPVATATVPDAPFEFNTAWRDAVVNLYCVWPYSDESLASGSGVIIDPRGIILTNAHVGVNFLFYDTPKESAYECWVRTGSPSKNMYRAKLLYIPSKYISEEVGRMGKYVPEEEIAHGKNDYALLLITKTVDPKATLPTAFPYLSLDEAPIPAPGSSMYMAGYPGGFLGAVTVMYGLSLIHTPVIVDSISSIKGSLMPDTLVFKGSIVGQHGSSGGAVIRRGGKLTAIPSYFKEKAPTTGDSILEAITIEYINRDSKIDTGFSLPEFITRDTPPALLDKFQKEKAPLYHGQYVEKARELTNKN